MKIAIVNDLPVAVETIGKIVASSADYRIAWIAHDGAEAVDKCARDTPDLILMDLLMPKMDGVQATRQIMRNSPCAIVVVTADVEHSSSKVFEAMGAGALDAVDTPVVINEPGHRGALALLAKLETIRRLLGLDKTRRGISPRLRFHSETPTLVMLGASAGGPAAMAKILGQLPVDFPAPIVAVQHVDERFAGGLTDWLGSQTKLPVKLAAEGDRARAGEVLLGGRNSHLVFTGGGILGYSETPASSTYRPSVDVLFRSAERFWEGRIVAVLLTGMGRDGAEGLRRLKNLGHHTICQDRESCAVYGMPKAAAEIEAAVEILGLDKIGTRLRNMVSRTRKSHV